MVISVLHQFQVDQQHQFQVDQRLQVVTSVRHQFQVGQRLQVVTSVLHQFQVGQQLQVVTSVLHQFQGGTANMVNVATTAEAIHHLQELADVEALKREKRNADIQVNRLLESSPRAIGC